MTTGSVPPRRLVLALGAVSVLGLALRVMALDYGLPGVYNPDEIPILNRALALAKGDPSPHNFLYPSLYFYMLFAWEALFLGVGRLLGLYESVAAFQNEFFLDPSRIILAARALTALCGIVAIVFTYRLGARLYGRTVGTAAALFVATSPFLVRDAHYIKLDVPVTMFTVIAHASIARLVVDRAAAATRSAWMVAGFLSGLAMSTQYYVIFIIATIAAVALGDVRRSGSYRTSLGLLLVAGLGAAAGFVAGTPFFFLELDTALRDIAGVRQVDVDRALSGGGGAFTSLVPYLRMLATDAIGWPVFAAAIGGIVAALVTNWRRAAVLVVFPLTLLAFIAHTVPMSRYTDAMLPMIGVAGAYGLVRAASLARSRRGVVATALVVAAATPGLVLSVRSNRFFAQDDTRTLASEFIEREIPAGASILTQPYSAPIRMSRDALVEALRAHLADESRASIKFQLQLAVSPYPSPAYRLIYYGDGGEDVDRLYILPHEVAEDVSLAALRRHGIEYVILKRTNVPNAETAALEAALAAYGRLLATFSPYRSDVDPARRSVVSPFFHNTATRIDPALARPGPIVDVWQVR
jgi:hypothetical protein